MTSFFDELRNVRELIEKKKDKDLTGAGEGDFIDAIAEKLLQRVNSISNVITKKEEALKLLELIKGKVIGTITVEKSDENK